MLNLLKSFSSQLSNDCLKVCKEIKTAGGVAYLVGGCVRDGLLQRQTVEADIEVYGLEPEKLFSLLSKFFKVDLVGKSYAVFKLQKNNIDVSVPRQETKLDKGHKSFYVDAQPYLDPYTAGLRRDFTVNALMYDPLENKLLDEHGGLQDLKNKRLRHVSDKFGEDPLRVLRAMQFISRFDFDIDKQTMSICRTLDQDELPKERIFEEWKKMLLTGNYISKGLSFLFDCGWIRYYPHLAALYNCPQDKLWHPEGDVWQHTILCLDAFAFHRSKNNFSAKENLIIGFAVLTHDLGKVATTYYEKNRIRSPKHEIVGVPLARAFMGSLTNNVELVENCLLQVRHHMQPYALYKNKSGPAAIRRLANKVKRVDWLIAVSQADYLGCQRSFDQHVQHLQWLKEQTQQLDVVDKSPQPLILGRHIMDFGLAPGKIYKDILNDCFEAQLAGEFYDVESGLKTLKTMLIARNLIPVKD